MPSFNDILAVILGGGQGKRLYPLTMMRSKPAVPIAGKYRLIDIPISNCINSDIYRIAVLTQFNSVSLHKHITGTYNFNFFIPAGCKFGLLNRQWNVWSGIRGRLMLSVSNYLKFNLHVQSTC